MTKPCHRSVPPPGTIAAPLEEAAAAISLSPESFLKLQAAGWMPKPRKFPNLRRKAYDLDEIRAAFRALPRDGEEVTGVSRDPDRDDDSWSKVGV
jgi:hypothetical protein